MKATLNSTGRFFGVAGFVIWLAIQSWPLPLYLEQSANPVAISSATMTPAFDRDRVTKEKAHELYTRLPLRFEANLGQTDSRVKFLSRAAGFNLFLTSTDAVFELRSSSGEVPQRSENVKARSSVLRMRFHDVSPNPRVVGLDELPGKSNYFIGNDPRKWRTNVPAFLRVKYQNVYPGIDLLYYGNQRQLEYDFIVAPGASSKAIALTFEGARRVRLDDSGDLLIETSTGEIRQRKPLIYQQADGIKQPVGGSYVIRGDRRVGFDVDDHDPSRAIVIDPVLIYSTSLGGSGTDSANAVALDDAGNAYITGETTSINFPLVNAFQPGLKTSSPVFVFSDAFVSKLNPPGTALLYSTYLGGGRVDIANGIAVDAGGSAYVTGATASNDFPTTAGTFQPKPSNSGDAFITKLSPGGNTLAFSTFLGGSILPGFKVIPTLGTAGRGIAVDREGSAYVTGYTFSENFPLKKPVQGLFNMGSPFGGDCQRFNIIPTIEDAFVTKLDPSGAKLVYSTYLGGTNTDEAYGIALDSTGSAYITGATCSPDFPASSGIADANSAAFLVKVSPSGKKFVYARRFGGRGFDSGNAVAVDLDGNAYVAGKTDSDDFPTTPFAFQARLGGSVLYETTDGGAAWRSIAGFSNSPASAVAIDTTNPLRVFVGFLGRWSEPGLLVSTDGGSSWGNTGQPFPSNFTWAVAIDPKNPSIIYTDLYKSTDGGMSWRLMSFPLGGPIGPARLLIDPVTTSTVYLIALGGLGGDVVFPPRFFKTTDGGNTWSVVRKGTSAFEPTSAVLDPKNPSTLYAINADLYKSTDGGNTWRVPYEGFRGFFKLAIDPVNTSTLYLCNASGSLFKTTDAGISFTDLGNLGVRINELLVDPINTTTVYAATGTAGDGGGVFKSTDGGKSWNATGLIAAAVNALAIDPLNPSRVFAGVDIDIDSFVVKSNAAGSALIYATYLGSRSPDFAAGIGVDAVGSAYVTGRTFSDRFPTKDALQEAKPSGLFDPATFVTKVDATGTALRFSTYVGGADPTFVSGIAVDPAGKACVVGTTGRLQPAPAGPSTESVHGGFDAFVIKIVSPPRIVGVSVAGKNLIVSGEGFDNGAVILIDGVAQTTRNDESRTATTLIARKAAKVVSPGQIAVILVRNADGLMSESVSFTRVP